MQYLKTILILVVLVLSGISGCGYHPPLNAELYQPEIHADHRIDVAKLDDIANLYQMMKDTHEVFTKCGVTYWAEGGTALGAVRNRGIIPWDDDNDVMMPMDSVPQMLLLRDTFDQLGYFIEKVFFGYRIVKRGTTAGLDIFLVKEHEGKFFYDGGDWGRRDGGALYIRQDEVFPLQTVPFGHIVVNIPHNPDPYLNAMFRGWQNIAFTYGHLGQRKFKIDLTQHLEFKQPAPLDEMTLAPIDISGVIQNRVDPNLVCPHLSKERGMPFPPFYDHI